MAEYTSPKASSDKTSNASAENFEFDISSAITSANIPAYSEITKATLTVWGDIDTSTSRGKMTASFGSESICSDVWCGGYAGEVSRSKDLTVSTFFNSKNANAGKLKDSSTRLNIKLDGPVMLDEFKHTASWQLYIEWTPHSHSYTTPTYTWSADGKTCTARRECSCGFFQEVSGVTIPKVLVEATCTTVGTTRYTTNFGESWTVEQTKDIQDIAAKGHTWVAATCTTPKTCSVCGATEGSALGHNYTSSVVAPTETSHGYTRHTCTRCGHYYDDSYTYLVRWYNEDGSVLLETDSSVPYGDMPSCSVTPTKAATAQNTYTHIGWAISPTAENTTGLTAVVANIDYYARFRADIKKYTVTWKNDDGTVLETDTLVPYGDQPDYNGETPTKTSTAQYDYTFLGWSAMVDDDEGVDDTELPTVMGNIIYTAVYLPMVRQYDLNIVTYDCTIEGAVNGTYDYGTEFTIKVNPNFGYEFVRITDVEYGTDYTDNTVTFILTGDTTLHCVCERALAPIFVSPEQQVKEVYIVPVINTIVYQVEGDLPTLEIKMDKVDGWHFAVINTSIDESSVYQNYDYYPVEKLYVNETRIW